MAGTLEDLMAMTRSASHPDAPPVPIGPNGQMAAGPATMQVSTADPMGQLQQLLGTVAASPQGGQMLQAVTQMMGGAGGNGGAQGQIPNYTGPQTMKPGGYADDALDVPQGTAPNDSAAERLPGQKNMGAYLNANRVPGKDASYAGQNGADDYQDEYDDGSGSSAFVNKEGKGNKMPSNQDTVRDQIGKKQGMSTEDELDMVSKNMGKSGDPSADGNFPTPQEIRDLLGGYTSEKEFDAKWGQGAAQELYPDRGPGNGPPGQQLMGDYLKSKNNNNDDDGDHEYR